MSSCLCPTQSPARQLTAVGSRSIPIPPMKPDSHPHLGVQHFQTHQNPQGFSGIHRPFLSCWSSFQYHTHHELESLPIRQLCNSHGSKCGFQWVALSQCPPQQVCTPAALRWVWCYKHVMCNHSEPCVGHLYSLSPSCTIWWEVLNYLPVQLQP